jgi:DNA-binding NarL/FixJ family response regulator
MPEDHAKTQNPYSVIRTLVVDDYEPFRRLVCSMLGKVPELHLVAEASDGLEAVQKAEELRPDLIVLDIGLPTLNGIEAAQQISTIVPGATILFVSQKTDALVIEAALGLGVPLSNRARGYVLKKNANTELLPAVEAILRGERFVSRGVTQQPAMPTVE